ncbi:MAG: TolC family protein [Gammaproteobacteria bacterium]
MKISYFRFSCVALGMLAAQLALSAQPDKTKLPDTLTLDYALSLADAPHPQLMLQEARLRQAQADQAVVDTDDDARIALQGRLRYVEPPDTYSYLSHNNSAASVTVTKDLYDFGRQTARSKAASAEVNASQFAFLDARAKRRLVIMQRYFNVILADLKFNRYNEEMAVAYVSYDRMRKRQKVGERSNFQVQKLEARYQQVRYLKVSAENDQRRTRALLADALNHPGELPSDLARPDLSVLKRKLPDYDALLATAMSHNYRIKSLQDKLLAAQQQVEAARASQNPRLYGQVGVYDYARDLGGYDKYRAGIYIKVPLFAGSRTDALTASAQANLYKIQAELKSARMQLQQQVLNTWLDLQNLQARRQEMSVVSNYRDLNLDRSRALYEMEVTADLGDSMVKVTDAEYLSRKADYEMAEAWMKLDILTGQLKLPEDKPKS